jgi:hypothetical protein
VAKSTRAWLYKFIVDYQNIVLVANLVSDFSFRSQSSDVTDMKWAKKRQWGANPLPDGESTDSRKPSE